MALWNKQPFEDLLENKLVEKLGPDEGRSFFSRYTCVRDRLIDEVLSEIPGSEPNLSKHDALHIKQLLVRAYQLLGDDCKKLSEYELYTLGISILFHDSGNLFGRDNHHAKDQVAKVYNGIRGSHPKWRQERHVILTIIESHTGKERDGSASDTLQKVELVSSLENGEKIRIREIASILRFADELEEGPLRTSFFRQSQNSGKGSYPESSKPYHEYANITNVVADRGNGRIVIRYHIDFDTKKDARGVKFKKALEFAYERIIKLDDERQYTKYYSELLLPFKKTEVSFHFSINEIPIEMELEPLVFADEIPIPGRKRKKSQHLQIVTDQNKNYDVKSILKKIQKKIK